jgi:hypothetical protein
VLDLSAEFFRSETIRKSIIEIFPFSTVTAPTTLQTCRDGPKFIGHHSQTRSRVCTLQDWLLAKLRLR